MPILTTPKITEQMWARDRLFGRYHIERGVSLLVTGSTVRAAQYPLQEELDDYDHVYMGGKVYDITSAEAAVLTAAGYGAYIT